MCQHLDKLITPKRDTPFFESVNHLAGNNVDRHQPLFVDRAKEKADFIAKVSAHLEPVEVNVLVLRYVFNENFSNIAVELKLVCAETAERVHKTALQKLKEKLK